MSGISYPYQNHIQNRAGLLFSGSEVGETMTTTCLPSTMTDSHIIGSAWYYNDPEGAPTKTAYDLVFHEVGGDATIEVGLHEWSANVFGYKVSYLIGTSTYRYLSSPFVNLAGYSGWVHIVFSIDFERRTRALVYANTVDVGMSSQPSSVTISDFTPGDMTLDLGDVYEGSGLAQVHIMPIDHMDSDTFEATLLRRYSNGRDPFSQGFNGEGLISYRPWVYLSFMDKGGETTGLFNDSNTAPLTFENASNYQRSKSETVIVPGSPGHSAEIGFSSDELPGYYALTKRPFGDTAVLGRYVAFSAFYWLTSSSNAIPLEIDLGFNNTAYLLADDQVRISMNIVFLSSGDLDNVNSRIQVETEVDGAFSNPTLYTLNSQVNFSATGGEDTALKNINHANKKPLWVFWSLDLDDPSTFKLYLNSCLVRTVKQDTGSTYVYASPPSLHSYGLKQTIEQVASIYAAHQWFATSQNSVLIEEDFRWNFVDEINDYTAKNLVDGEVSGVDPHYYFSTSVHPTYDSRTDATYGVSDQNQSVSSISGSSTAARWYGEYDHYYAAPIASGDFYVRPEGEGAVIGANTKLFYSCWRKTPEGEANQGISMIRWSNDPVAGSARVGSRRQSGSNQDDITLHDDDEGERTTVTIDPAGGNVDFSGVWEHMMGYYDASDGSGYFYLDGVGYAYTSDTVSASTPSPFGTFLLVREGGDRTGLMGVTHTYRETIIDANPSIPWADGAQMIDLFLNSDGSMPDPGLKGDLNLDLIPDCFFQPSLGLGLSGIVDGWYDQLETYPATAEMVLPYGCKTGAESASNSVKLVNKIEVGA